MRPAGDTKVWGWRGANVGGRETANRSYSGRKSRAMKRASFSHGEESLIRLLLLLPFIGLMIVPFYNIREPMLFGFPFFYWYQLAWVPLTSLLTWIVYRSVRDAD